MAFLVDQGHDSVHSESYRSASESFKSKIEVEAANQLAKPLLGQSRAKKKGATESE